MTERKHRPTNFCSHCFAPLSRRAKRCSYCHKRVLTWRRLILTSLIIMLMVVAIVLLIDVAVGWYERRLLEMQGQGSR